jgi:hypothetical protein
MNFSATSRLAALRRLSALLVYGIGVAACSDSTAPDGGDCNAFSVIMLDTPVQGILSRSDCKRGDNTFEDKFRLTLTEAAEVQIDLVSSQFDAFLMIRDANGVELANDDDSGEEDNAQLVIALPAGTYTIAANSYYPLMTGGYVLAVVPVNPA